MSLIIASLLLRSGFNKMLLHSHRPSGSLQGDVTLTDVGLYALSSNKAGTDAVLVLATQIVCVNVKLFVCRANFLSRLGCPVHFLTILYPVNKNIPTTV